MRRFYTDEGPIDQLLQLYEAGKTGVWDGNLIGKRARDHFLQLGWCERMGGGFNVLTLAGARVVEVLKLARVKEESAPDFAEVGEAPDDLAKRMDGCEAKLDDLVRSSARLDKHLAEVAGLLGQAEVDVRKLAGRVDDHLHKHPEGAAQRPDFAEAWDEAGRVAAASPVDDSVLFRVVCALVDNMPPLERRRLLRFITDRKLEEF